MHKRHGTEVNAAIERELEKHKAAVRGRTLPRDSLLRLTYDTGGTGAAAPAKQESIERQEERWKEEEVDPNTYRLIREYKCWRLIYQGKEAVLATLEGPCLNSPRWKLNPAFQSEGKTTMPKDARFRLC